MISKFRGKIKHRIIAGSLFVFFIFWANIAGSTIPSDLIGIASWYAEFSPGIKKTTANMEIFDHDKLTCAIWDFPFDAMLEVTNIDNEKKVIVRVNDRGPARRLQKVGRIIDLSRRAFKEISDLDKGLINVRVRVINLPKEQN